MKPTPEVFPQLAWQSPESAASSKLEGSRNCAAASGAAAANCWPQGQFVTHHDFRLAAGNPKRADGTPSGLSSSNVLRGLHALGVSSASRHYGESIEIGRAALLEGSALIVAVDYGEVNDHFARLSGQSSFRGGHSWLVYDYTPKDPRLGGRNSCRVDEGLYDGRRAGIPKGPMLAPFRAVVAAAGAFRVGSTTGDYQDGKPIGAGAAVFVIVPEDPNASRQTRKDLALASIIGTANAATGQPVDVQDAAFAAIIAKGEEGQQI